VEREGDGEGDAERRRGGPARTTTGTARPRGTAAWSAARAEVAPETDGVEAGFRPATDVAVWVTRASYWRPV